MTWPRSAVDQPTITGPSRLDPDSIQATTGCDGAKPFKLGPGGRAERLGRPEFDDKRVLVAPALNGHGLEVASVKR